MHLQDGAMNQKGFTLIEILVVMLVGGMVMAAALSITHHIFRGTDRTNSQTVALTDAAQAAHRIKKDLMMTQNTNLTYGGPPQSAVSLTWTDYTSSFGSSQQTPHSSAYALSDNNLLQRTYDGTVSIVGRSITSLGFTQDGQVITVAITATGPKPQQRMESIQFSIHMRPEVTQ
ncbi:MAG: prepilin-type N-terminal cleavage/methylation domain-containing protein [Dehalococcoidales bacterium]|nr:prepilin-type N-terminal cleavage/methylation domain-containing protein [Dehalococcoidales bacterium]